MSVARKCDRCGKFYNSYTIQDNRFPYEVNGIAFARIYDSGECRAFDKDSYDLCKKCFEDMHAFFKNPERFAEKKHGRWARDNPRFSTSFCSVCHKEAIAEWNESGGEYALTNYCPHCGACMDAAEDQGGGAENAVT